MESERDDEEEQEAKVTSFFSWAADLRISDSFSRTQPEDSSRRPTCLGHSLFVSHFPEAGGRGLAAARDLRKGELILKVPKHALMTTQSLMMRDEKLSFALNKHPSLSSTQILAVALLNEVSKAKRSWWYPYLKQIPRSYYTLSTFCHLEIQALQIDDAVWAAEMAIEKAELEWKGACPILSELEVKPQCCTLKAWLWASSTISSRTMHISWDNAGCLCPIGDFFNYAAPGEKLSHSEFPETDVKDSSLNCYPLGEEYSDSILERIIDAGYEEDAAAYCFYARRKYRKGEQVLVSYGTYTNLELVEHYGFLLNNNPNDKVFITLEPAMYPLCPWRRESLYIHRDGKPSFALLVTLRLWAIPGNQRRSSGHLAYSGNQLSAENEVFVMKWLAGKCHTVLNALPTSVEQDEFLLSILEKHSSFSYELLSFLETNHEVDTEICLKSLGRKSTYRLQLAVHWRLNYKRTIADCIKHCTKVMNKYVILTNPPRT